MLPLNIPFLPDDDYLDFLVANEAQLATLHYSLYDIGLQDARIQLEEIPVEELLETLRPLTSTKKYVLANGRFHTGSLYSGGELLQTVIRKLDRLLEAGQLDGIVFSDSYMLTALGDAAPCLAASIEAVPSVNFQVDGIEKLAALIELISLNGYKLPTKMTLDRSLNKKAKQLAELTARIRKRWPQLQVELLANEGCLSHCPSCATHEALISLANCGSVAIDTKQLNDRLACVRWLSDAPHRILASPFIRPEDVPLFEDKADVIKICGRSLGRSFLRCVAGAYMEGRWNGNLLDLLDASHWMADIWDLSNQSLPDDFFHTTQQCTHDCANCSWCKEIFERLAVEKPFTLADRRSVSSPARRSFT